MFKLDPRSWFRRATLRDSNARDDGAWTSLSAEDISAVIDRGMGAILEPAGFELVVPHKWVRGNRAPIREVVDYQAFKGGTYQPEWGVSLDVVPTPVGGRLKWKRTSKSALLDLRLNRIGAAPTHEMFVSRIVRRQRNAALAEFEQRAARASQLALRQLDSIATITDIVDAFEKWSSNNLFGLGSENFVQTDLAWGLSLIACGGLEAGEQRLERACNRLNLDPSDRVLIEAKAAALEWSV